jgi:hypothetical protein
MAVQPVSDSQAWMQFLNVAKAARARNPELSAGVQAPRQTAQSSAASRYLPQVRVRPTDEVVPGSLETAQKPKPKQTLGTRFDAYA